MSMLLTSDQVLLQAAKKPRISLDLNVDISSDPNATILKSAASSQIGSEGDFSSVSCLFLVNIQCIIEFISPCCTNHISGRNISIQSSTTKRIKLFFISFKAAFLALSHSVIVLHYPSLFTSFDLVELVKFSLQGQYQYFNLIALFVK